LLVVIILMTIDNDAVIKFFWLRSATSPNMPSFWWCLKSLRFFSPNLQGGTTQIDNSTQIASPACVWSPNVSRCQSYYDTSSVREIVLQDDRHVRH
jgi:hypothetical protein